MDIAVAHLIQANIRPERVLNFWDLPVLEAWLARKQVRGPARHARSTYQFDLLNRLAAAVG